MATCCTLASMARALNPTEPLASAARWVRRPSADLRAVTGRVGPGIEPAAGLLFLCPGTQPLGCSSIVYAAAELGNRQSFMKAERRHARAAFFMGLARPSYWVGRALGRIRLWKEDEASYKAAVQGAAHSRTHGVAPRGGSGGPTSP